MKIIIQRWILAMFLIGTGASAQTYTNYLRQVQMPSGVSWDASSTVLAKGSQPSSLAINQGGARFDLWTILSTSPAKEYLIATRYVSSSTPLCDVSIRTEDPYSVIRRTRADRPFWVDITTSGLLSGATDPEPSKSVTLHRHVQSYGAAGSAVGLNRDKATLFSKESIKTNGMQTKTITVSKVPGSPLTKLCGEERFSVFSLANYQAPASTLDSQFVQIWPVADGSISGIASGQLIRFSMPAITVATNDLYPGSTCYLQYYKGSPVLGKTGDRLAWSNNKSSATEASPPESSTFSDLDKFFDSDGIWTIELLTGTPFGTDRLAFVSFTVDRTIEVNGTVTTTE